MSDLTSENGNWGTIKWHGPREKDLKFYKVNKDLSIMPLGGFTWYSTSGNFHHFDRSRLSSKFHWAINWDRDKWYPADPAEAPLIWFPVWNDGNQ